MKITEVRIKLVTNPNERLRAFCSITLDGDFVVRDLKIIEGGNGVFVAMPSRKLADRCSRCGCKNHLRSKFCNECGVHLKENRAPKDVQGRAKLHADIAHPINAACRERIQEAVVEAYEAELEQSKLPGYKPQSFDDFDDYEVEATELEEAVSSPTRAAADEPSAGQAEEFGEYNSLIADLKRDAADRQKRSEPIEVFQARSARLPASEGHNAIGKPIYTKRRRDQESDRPAEPAPARESSPSPESVGNSSQDSDDDAFGAGLL